MPHSGGGGSHSGGGHHGGGHSSGHGGSGGSSVRVSSTPFHGSHTYAIYDKYGHSRIVYSDSSNYHAEMTKGQLIGGNFFGAIFMLPGVCELIAIVVILASFFSFGVKKTTVPSYVDRTVYIYDTLDHVSLQEEERLLTALEDFRDKTGIIPAVEFTDEMYASDYTDLEAFAYNEYVVKFSDEYHLLILYSFGERNDATGFEEFRWESMWGDNLGKTAKTSDENYLADRIQTNLSRANGTGVADAITTSFQEFYQHLNKTGIKVEPEKLFVCLFLLIHGGVFFGAGLAVILGNTKKYKESQAKGESTYKINGTPQTMACQYCGTTYYLGTIGNCKNCGAALIN